MCGPSLASGSRLGPILCWQKPKCIGVIFKSHAQRDADSCALDDIAISIRISLHVSAYVGVVTQLYCFVFCPTHTCLLTPVPAFLKPFSILAEKMLDLNCCLFPLSGGL